MQLVSIVSREATEIIRYFPLAKPGDVMYSFISDEESWQEGCGSEGYCLVREDLVVDSIIFTVS